MMLNIKGISELKMTQYVNQKVMGTREGTYFNQIVGGCKMTKDFQWKLSTFLESP